MKTGGVDPVRRDDGSIAFLGRDGGEPLGVIPAPFMYDGRADAAAC